MATQITQIYDDIAAMSVSVSAIDGRTITPTVYDLHQLRNWVGPGGEPCRLLLPFGGFENVTGTISQWTAGGNSTVTWTILDRLLWREVGEGWGLQDTAEDLMRYAGAYMDAVNSEGFSSVSTDRMAEAVSVTVTIRDNIQFPEFSGSWYVGADAVWTIEETDP